MRTLGSELLSWVQEALPELGAEAKAALAGRLQAGLGRLSLVSREEFDVQKAVLARTRSRLEALERQIAELERGSLEGRSPIRP